MTVISTARAEVPGLIALATPIIVAMTAGTAVPLIDTIMLAPLGTTPLAAASLTTSVIIIFYAALYGFSGPVGLLAGQAHGAGDTPRLGRIGRHGAVLALLGGGASFVGMLVGLAVLPAIGQPTEVVAIIGPYWLAMALMLIPFTLDMVAKNLLNATNRAWTAAWLSMVPIPVNIVFNWLLIHGNLGLPALGLTGAGIASLLAQCAGCAVSWWWVSQRPALAGWWTSPGLSRAELAEQIREGMPMGLQYLLEGGAVAVIGLLVGYLGAVALAANQIAFTIGGILYMMPICMSIAVSLRVAQAVGGDDRPRVAAIGLAGLAVVIVWSSAVALIFFVAGGWLAATMVDDPAVIATAAALFAVFGCAQLLDGLQSVSLGALRGLLDNQWPTRVSLTAYWLVAIPVGALLGLALGFGAPGVWAGYGFGLLVAASALTWRFAAKSGLLPAAAATHPHGSA